MKENLNINQKSKKFTGGHVGPPLVYYVANA